MELGFFLVLLWFIMVIFFNVGGWIVDIFVSCGVFVGLV